MPNNQYHFVDPDHIYTDPNTNVLKNLVNATDSGTLRLIESGAVTKRLAELQANPIQIKDSSTLLNIHKHLFQDVYSWAGEKRTVEISKEGTSFFPLSHFNTAFHSIDTLIQAYRKIDKDDKSRLTHKLAEILDHINHLHPFREGNGRAQREFLRLLAMEKGLSLNLNPPDNADVYERYMTGTINGDVQQLATLISDIATVF